MKYMVYDIETFPNIFTFCAYDIQSKNLYFYEISDRKNQRAELLNFLNYYQQMQDYYFVGFNNLHFDYSIIHDLILSPTTFTYQRASELANQIIKSGDQHWPVRQSERKLKQIDLFKINHFDNRAKSTSLKALQFAMRSNSVDDLPFDIRNLNDEEKDKLIKYNIHDVEETVKFFYKCEHLIKIRKDIIDSKMIYGDVLNFADTKIGAEFLIKELGKDSCYEKGILKQTIIQSLQLKTIILNKIKFYRDDYNEIMDWYRTKTWYSSFENDIKLEKKIDNFTFHLGVGGIHGSVSNEIFESNEEWQIIDLDVASLYPSIGIVNKFYPLHLGERFVEKYENLKNERFKHAKGTSLNAMYKSALNGAYGNSNNPYSPFYDPSYMLKITINGQLQLLQLAEVLFSLPKVIPIQINTDGVTCYVHKSSIEWFNLNKDWWQKETGLELEEALYNKMIIRDVNNYIAVTNKGKIKSKGAYWYPEKDSDYDGCWNKDFSAMVVQKAARECLLKNYSPEFVVRLFTDPFDFMLRYKTPRGSLLMVNGVPCSKTVRYYVSKKGHSMYKYSKPTGVIGEFKRKNKISDEYYEEVKKIIPPNTWDERIHTKNKSVHEPSRITGIESGSLVKVCNKVEDFDWNDLDYDYYIKEVDKLMMKEKKNV